jgi:hypothetical protein
VLCRAKTSGWFAALFMDASAPLLGWRPAFFRSQALKLKLDCRIGIVTHDLSPTTQFAKV